MMFTARVTAISMVYLGLSEVRKINTRSMTTHSRLLRTSLLTSFCMSTDTS